MDIRPVDVQMFINKSSQANKYENNSQRSAEQGFVFSEHLKKNIESENKKTIQSNKSEDSQISKDGKGKGFNRDKKENSKKKEKEQEKRKEQKLSFLDIKI